MDNQLLKRQRVALTVQQLIPISFQATIFTPGLTFDQSRILSFVLTELADRLDDAPVSLPKADRLPPAVPRIVVQSKDKRYKLEAGPARFNLYNLKVDQRILDLDEFVEFATETFRSYVDTINARVGRLAAVLTRAAKVPDPAAEISGRFCRDEYIERAFQGSETFEIHNHKKYRLEDRFHVNGWVRWKCGFEGNPQKRQRLVIVQQDINTLSEDLDSLQFAHDEIAQYFRAVKTAFDSTLATYVD
jgi:hypothetical protein